MAQIKPEYEALDQFSELAAKLVDKYPSILAGIDHKEIRCYAITNKERPEKAKEWSMKAIGQPIRIDCPYGWYVVVYLKDWEEKDEAHKLAMVMDILCGVGEEGKVNPFDVKEHGVMIRTLGVDFQDKPAIPHLLNDNVNFVVRTTSE